jgi:hypothetical protein
MSKITFKANKNTVTANTYVAHELYKRNEAIINKLGGEIIRGVGDFKAQFPSNAKAKAFVEQAITSISKREYNATRKTEPKVAPAPKQGKGKSNGKYITLTDDDGNTYKVALSALGIAPKGKSKPTTKKASAPKAPAPKGKGNNKNFFDFGKLAGKGVKYNTQASALIVKAGYKHGTTEYHAAWEIWKKVR